MKYVHAYAKPPSETQPDDHSIRCISPVFGVEADVKIEVVVGVLNGTQRVIRGSEKYTYFGARLVHRTAMRCMCDGVLLYDIAAAPSLTSVTPNCLALSGTQAGPVVRISAWAHVIQDV